MHIPQQVSDRVKEAPAQALRAVFAGIGQVLLTADRVRTRATEYQRARAAAVQANQALQAARPAQPRQDRPPTPREETRWRSLDETGNVRLLSRDEYREPDLPTEVAESETAAPAAEPAAAPEAVAEPTPEPVAEPAAEVTPPEPEPTDPEPETATAEAAEPAAAEATVGTPDDQQPDEGLIALPVPNYDGLTVPSLRARLRNLDPAQLRLLIDYEKAHAGRADVLTMFERRITKLEDDSA
jgi:hypothetical protein